MKRVQDYILYKELGEGVTAKVYLGVDQRNKKIVAVKVLNVDRLKDPKMTQQLRSELSLLKKLKNEHVISLMDFIQSKKHLYIILDYCNGGNLFDFRCKYTEYNHSKLNEVIIQKIIRQLVIGLEYMHKQNIIHRDIKSENILLNFTDYPNEYTEGKPFPKVNFANLNWNADFILKIADLGVAKRLNEGVSSTLCGTPITMAPDIMMGGGGYDTKADLWSLGTIAYELLTGELPFSAGRIEELKSLIAKGIYRLPRNLQVSQEIISFINGLLQFYPEKRMNWEQIKKHPFIMKKVSEFHFLDLQNEGGDPDNMEFIEFNTKTWNNPFCMNDKMEGNDKKVEKEEKKEEKGRSEKEIKEKKKEEIKEEKKEVNEAENYDGWIELDISFEEGYKIEEILKDYKIINDYV